MKLRAAVLLAGAVAATVALAGCGGGRSDVCANADGALTNTAFVFLTTPGSGERVSSGFPVAGCSSTFEGEVDWTLRARDGRVLASGIARGGGFAPGSFRFSVTYSTRVRQVGQLEVVGSSATSTEGFPPVENVVPLVLEP